MSKPPDPLRQLARLARVADPGGRNIGEHLRQHADELAERLDVPKADLLAAAAMPDDALAPRVESALKRIRDAHLASLLGQDAARALVAARTLHDRARCQDGAVVLEPGLLLGDLLADRKRPHVLFALHDGSTVAVRTGDLVATAKVLRHRPDLATFVDLGGIHIRWRGGRGGLNWHPRVLTAAEQELALRVELPGPVQPPAPAPARKHRLSWTWDVMSDLGFAT